MNTDKDDLEPLTPDQGQDLFLDHKSTDCAESTVRNHTYRTNHFVEWCEEDGIENLNELSGRDIQRYRLWRKETGDINNLTLRMNMSTLRVFLKWAGTIEAVPENLYTKVMVPRVSREERQRDEVLDAETARDILAYLTKYKYASSEHILLSLLWETGMRIGGANSIDLDDVSFEDSCIRLVHRPGQGTRLKNGQGGERLVAVTSDLAELLEDYIEDRRHDVSDDHDRDPLLTTENYRMSRSTMRKIVYRYFPTGVISGIESPG